MKEKPYEIAALKGFMAARTSPQELFPGRRMWKGEKRRDEVKPLCMKKKSSDYLGAVNFREKTTARIWPIKSRGVGEFTRKGRKADPRVGLGHSRPGNVLTFKGKRNLSARGSLYPRDFDTYGKRLDLKERVPAGGKVVRSGHSPG